MQRRESWRVVQRQESWHVLEQNGVLLIAFPTRAEAQAWVAGVRHGIDMTMGIFKDAMADVNRRFDGAARNIELFRTDTTGIS